MKNKFYITAAIDYSNGNPHMGHAFEKIGVDVLARFHREQGRDVYCLVGTDEHSQNVVKKAKDASLTPQAYCDKMAALFKSAYDTLQVQYDRFIRTSDRDHHEMVKWISQKVFEHGDIYKNQYEGFYCVSCEAFYQEKDLQEGSCPVHKRPASKLKEENYFFKLSKYQNRLVEHIHKHPEFIQPESRRNEVLSFLKEPLLDISISRATHEWGITLPFDSKAVAYVWFDALTNYMTGVGPVGADKFKKYWPADLHVVGKDITRFHCVIWPIMLMSAGVELPKTVWGHGFINLAGEKMSKTTGTLIDPLEIAKSYGVYTLRYFLMKEIPWDKDGDFSIERLIECHNADLANGVGNLLSRTVSMAHKYFQGQIHSKPPAEYHERWKYFKSQVSSYIEKFEHFMIHEALDETTALVRYLNLLIDEKKPWAMAKIESERPSLEGLLHTCLSGLVLIADQLAPIIPDKAAAMKEILGMKEKFNQPEQVAKLLTLPYSLKEIQPLFPRLEVSA